MDLPFHNRLTYNHVLMRSAPPSWLSDMPTQECSVVHIFSAPPSRVMQVLEMRTLLATAGAGPDFACALAM